MTRTTKEINLIYKYTHKDFKGKLDGVKSIMYLDPKTGASVLGGIESLPDSVYSELLRVAMKKESPPVNKESHTKLTSEIDMTLFGKPFRISRNEDWDYYVSFSKSDTVNHISTCGGRPSENSTFVYMTARNILDFFKELSQDNPTHKDYIRDLRNNVIETYNLI